MGDRRTGGPAPYALSILRIVTGLLFTCHGVQKLFGMFGGMGPNGGHAPYFSLYGLAGFIETIGGPLILVGLFTSPVAFILCGEMAVAYFHAHFPHGFWPIQNHGELPVLFCFIYLYLATAGGGPLSLDRAVRKK